MKKLDELREVVSCTYKPQKQEEVYKGTEPKKLYKPLADPLRADAKESLRDHYD